MSELRRRLAEENKRQGNAWGHITSDRFRAIKSFSGDKVLDVGCSNGVYVFRLLNEGYISYGVDLLGATEWQARPEVFSIADACVLPFADGSFETILSFEVLEHIPSVESALREYRRVCSRNIIITVPNCETPWELREAGYTLHHWIDRTHIQYFSLDSITSTVERCGFKIIHADRINATFPAVPLLAAFGVPLRVARKTAHLLNKLSPRKYYMSLLVVAGKA